MHTDSMTTTAGVESCSVRIVSPKHTEEVGPTGKAVLNPIQIPAPCNPYLSD